MAYSDDLKWERDRYSEALQHVRDTANDLQKAIGALRSADSIQKGCYKLNDVAGGSGYLGGLIEREQGIHSNIVNNIIPAINGKIGDLNWRIGEAEAQDAIEREG